MGVGTRSEIVVHSPSLMSMGIEDPVAIEGPEQELEDGRAIDKSEITASV